MPLPELKERLTFALTREERELIERVADMKNMRVSAFLRNIAVRVATKISNNPPAGTSDNLFGGQGAQKP